jgi:hypothetical protein
LRLRRDEQVPPTPQAVVLDADEGLAAAGLGAGAGQQREALECVVTGSAPSSWTASWSSSNRW